MIIGVGTDILEIARIESSFHKFGQKFVERILHPREQIIFKEKGCSVQWLAKRFAQKEAVVKALGTGIAQGITFQDIICVHDKLGKPMVELEGMAAEIAAKQGITQMHVSVSDERTHVCAFAVAS